MHQQVPLKMFILLISPKTKVKSHKEFPAADELNFRNLMVCFFCVSRAYRVNSFQPSQGLTLTISTPTKRRLSHHIRTQLIAIFALPAEAASSKAILNCIT